MFFPYALGLDQSKYSSMANYHEALTIYVISSILEVMSNPLYILAQNLLLLRLRSLIDMFSLLLRVAVTYVCLIIAPNAPLRAFALGQLANSCVPLVAYVTYFSAARGGLGVRGTALVLLGLGGAMDGAGMDWGLVRMAFTMCGKLSRSSSSRRARPWYAARAPVAAPRHVPSQCSYRDTGRYVRRDAQRCARPPPASRTQPLSVDAAAGVFVCVGSAPARLERSE